MRAFHFNSLAESILFSGTKIEPQPGDPKLFDFLLDPLALGQVLIMALLAIGTFYFMGRIG